jgi:hypothetical protein
VNEKERPYNDGKWTQGQMNKKVLLKADFEKLFDYRDGVLFWKEQGLSSAVTKSRLAGKKVGTLGKDGYLKTNFRVGGVKYICLVHRIIFVLFYDRWPNMIDHIDRNRSHNRIENLREVGFQGNALNKSTYKNNKFGQIGVGFRQDTKTWRARIMWQGKNINLGNFSTKEEAIIARKAGEEKYFTPNFL